MIRIDYYEADGTIYHTQKFTENLYADSKNDISISHDCERVEILHLTINHTQYAEKIVTACDSYTWTDGKTYTESGTYYQYLQTIHGCDSTVVLHLTVNRSIEVPYEVTACDSYTWSNGITYTQSGVYYDSLKTIHGCDSVEILTLTINATKYAEETVTACDSYVWNGETYTTSGEYVYTTTAANGCDSIITLHLTINQSEVGDTEYATICYGETYTWNGQTYAATGEYSVTLTNAAGCDSIATLHLTIMPEAVTSTESVVIGSDDLPYTWRGNTYLATGRYTDIEQYTQVDCDSAIHVLDLTVLTTGNFDEESITICETETPYMWYGESYTATGKYTYTEKYAGTDIDSVQHILNLTVNPTVYTEESMVACDSYTWNGEIYTESGEYTYTTTATNGCDSIVTLHLTINATKYTEETITACDSYTWNGETYTQSGEYVYTTTAANGCDSIVTLHLTVNHTQYTEESVTACDSYTWNGETYSKSGEYTYTTVAANGCDSVVTLHLTILPDAVTETEELVLCSSELPYEWYGELITEAGFYTVAEQYAVGCDSVVHELRLNVYVQTLPEQVTLPIVRIGEAIDVTVPSAEIYAHIASDSWYAPNALVEWYTLEDVEWIVLTTDPVPADIDQITLKYAVDTDCGSVESDEMVISLETTNVENSQSGNIDTYKIFRDGQLLIIRDGKTYNAQGAAL